MRPIILPQSEEEDSFQRHFQVHFETTAYFCPKDCISFVVVLKRTKTMERKFIMNTETKNAATPASDRELIISRLIDAPPEKVFRAWTEPELMKQWFAPKPWTTPRVETDVRPGGSSLVVMRSPDGTEMPCPGVYLEVVKNQKIVVTDAYTSAWQPSTKPFMTLILTFENEGGKTRYTARARHWTVEDRETHEKMGFHEGWGQCADQLAELVAKI
jgi:uncharacterized protein YndB with AHSA1/START domain